jgi:hypothetical protein
MVLLRFRREEEEAWEGNLVHAMGWSSEGG